MNLSRSLLSTAFLLPRSASHRTGLFHTASACRSKSVSYYETLAVDPSASAGDIKKQFYLLSKTHHPDHNPNDPEASERFVKISEAYATLGSPQKRERYDRDIQGIRGTSPSNSPRGSHSSSSTPFGSRPASGLSRRRTQFKGPPPSFYRSGGWGQQGKKRQAYAEGSGSAGTGEPRGGGFGPGQGQTDFDNVPHFDQEGHHRTQKQQDQRRRRRLEEESVGFADGALSIPTIFDKTTDGRKKDEIK